MFYGVYRHKKTGNFYLAFGKIINTTNRLDGQSMVLYGELGKDLPALTKFAREEKEFLEKFEKIKLQKG